MIKTTHIMAEFGKGVFSQSCQYFRNIFSKISNLWESRRPWGHYKVLENTPGRKVKTIFVKPNKRLSLQKHRHREEYWLVAEGRGMVRVGDKEVPLKAGNSIIIPKNTTHRVTNLGEDTLVFVEIQVGDYLEEDDIIRLDDDFGRI